MADKKPQYIEGVGWRYDTDHNFLQRMSNHDYTSRAIYMLTLTLDDRSTPLLGSLKWTEGEGERKGVCVATVLGEAVAEEWAKLESEYAPLEVMALQLMPEHLHVAVFVHYTLPLPLGSIVGKLKNRCNKHYWRLLTAAGKLAPKGEAKPPALFSEGFQDTILSHNGQLDYMLAYIRSNPTRALIKREHPALFQVVHELALPLPAIGGAAGGALANGAAERPRTEQQPRAGQQPAASELAAAGAAAAAGTAANGAPAAASAATSAAAGKQGRPFEEVTFEAARQLRFAAIGNRWLLDRPVRLQIRCHNNTSPENLQLIERQREYILARAAKGGVVVSPCISPGEKAIARAALDAGLPLIVVLENGFKPHYKPPGKYFEACARGLLLMLAPWPYHAERRAITRQQCLELNAITSAIATEPWTPELERSLT